MTKFNEKVTEYKLFESPYFFLLTHTQCNSKQRVAHIWFYRTMQFLYELSFH